MLAPLKRARLLRALTALALASSLSGCQPESPHAGYGRHRRAFKYFRFVEGARVSPGGGGDDSADDPSITDVAAPAKIKASKHTKKISDLTDQSGDPGERAPGWIGVLDVYFKLNWVRKSLLTGSVSSELPGITRRTLAHCETLTLENTRDQPDPIFHISPIMTPARCLEPATRALVHLRVGLEHMKQVNTLEAGSLNWRALPWGMGKAEMQRAFVNLGLSAPPETAPAPVFGHSDNDDNSNTLPRVAATRPALSLPQQQAVALALRYEEQYRASPEACARKEFEEAMRETLRMREMVNMERWRYADAVPGDNVTIVGPLHQETGIAPPSSTAANLPYASEGDTGGVSSTAGSAFTGTGGASGGMGSGTIDPMSAIGRTTGPVFH